MHFYDRLLEQTAIDRMALMRAPIIESTLRGEASLPSYVAFLREAYHHVRHTVPLLRACKGALPAQHAWLHDAMEDYVAEEQGHDEWILDDLRACGADPEAVRTARPGHATAVMVAYAYDAIVRRNPVEFFGMVHVLEGTSVALALTAADRIQESLALPDSAFRYLRSHGTLDQKHTAEFALLMNRMDDARDQADIVHATSAFFHLYGDVFRSLPLPQADPQRTPAGHAEALA